MADTPLAEIGEVTKTYHQAEMAIEVLRGISLTVNRGEFLALQGASGSGKSTLLHILGLLDRPTSGSYLLEGIDVSNLSDNAQSDLRNQKIGFVFQSFYLIPYASALNNVLLPGTYSPEPQHILKARAQELLEQVGLGDRASFRPSQLSGGQQQRVALARALINDPELVLADEPTGQLDSTTSKEIMELISRVNREGKTVIVVTHDEETARYASRRIFMRDGRIADS